MPSHGSNPSVTLSPASPQHPRRQPDRAARIGADGADRQPGGDGGRRARGRATADAVGLHVPGVPGRPHPLVRAPAAEGELDRPGLAEQNAARRDQTARDRGGRRRDPMLQRLRPSGRDPTLEVNDVLEREGNAVERPDPVPGGDRSVRGVGRPARLVRIDDLIASDAPVEPLDPLEVRLDDGARAYGAVEIGIGQRDQRGIDIVGGCLCHRRSFNRSCSPATRQSSREAAVPGEIPGIAFGTALAELQDIYVIRDAHAGADVLIDEDHRVSLLRQPAMN